ncbi:MAG: hypothetical protein FIA94_05695, partial [Nitrospirae bacterium]|nr:hypothetical protein [Nitrospirota bacterium]
MIQGIFHAGGTFLDIGAIAVLTGAAWLIIWISFCPEGEAALSGRLLSRIRRLLFLCLAALTISSADSLVQRAMEMSGTGLAASLPLLSTVLFKTHYGSMWLVRLAGLCAAWTVVFAGRKYTGSRFFAVLMLCSVAVIAFARSASGHPADYGDLSSQQLADWLHLLAVSSLGGALLAVAGISGVASASGDGAPDGVISCVAGRLYAWFGPVLAVMVLTGVYNAWFQAGSFGALATSAYGILLSVKLVLVFVLAFRYIAPPERGRDAALFAARFFGHSRTDAAILALVLLLVSILVHKIPAKHQAHIALLRQEAEQEKHEGYASPDTGPVVTLDTRPARITAGVPADMTVRVQDKDGKPLNGLAIIHERILHAVIIGQDLNAFAHIHPEDLGPITEDMVKRATLPLR